VRRQASLGLSADGATASEAAANLTELIQTRLANGVQLVTLTVRTAQPQTGRRCSQMTVQDGLGLPELQEAIAENRRLDKNKPLSN